MDKYDIVLEKVDAIIEKKQNVEALIDDLMKFLFENFKYEYNIEIFNTSREIMDGERKILSSEILKEYNEALVPVLFFR